MSANVPKNPTLTPNDGKMNANVLSAEYAVRGAIVQEATAMMQRKKTGEWDLPFPEVVFCNIGNPQALKQQPMTFLRQVLALCAYPDLMESAAGAFAADAVARAKQLLGDMSGGSMGAYSHSSGIPVIREHVAEFITERDGGVACDSAHVHLSGGASSAIAKALTMLIRNDKDGIMIPIPQYPLYSATIALCGGAAVSYYMNEETSWGMDVAELERSFNEAKAQGIAPRALVIINPGNPTGNVLSKDNMVEVVKFCERNALVLLADEVYQENIYGERPFHSFKKIVAESGLPVELFSFHSTSKGFLGECGMRGGYAELFNIAPEAEAQYYKLSSISLCSNLAGQIATDVMVRPPRDGEASYATWVAERDDILGSLKRRALKLVAALNDLPGVTCQQAAGAMYVFPNIVLPKAFVDDCAARSVKPDAEYALQLLRNAGICAVPGAGFGQRDGTFHLRLTFLPAEDAIDAVIARLTDFHKGFMAKHA